MYPVNPNPTPAQKTLLPPDDQVLCLSAAIVKKSFFSIQDICKAADPDDISGCVLKGL